jgi:transcriptional regulator with XRE-family HTH domain
MTSSNDGGQALARRRDDGSGPGYAAMGDRLRAARLARGVSVRGLAERLDVSPSLISQVETGRARPSVNTLYAIVTELGLSLDELLFLESRAVAEGTAETPQGSGPEGPAPELVLPDIPVQRADDRQTIRLASGVVWERLTTASLGSMDFLFVTYEVGGASSSEDALHQHPGQELGFIVNGRLEVRVGTEVHVLGPGDAIAFDSTTPHRLLNIGDEPVRAVWLGVGRRTSDHPGALQATRTGSTEAGR